MFLDELKTYLNKSIINHDLDLEDIEKLLISHKKKRLLKNLKDLSYNFNFYNQFDKFSTLFRIIKNFVKNNLNNEKRSPEEVDQAFLDSLRDQIVNFLVAEKFCSECNSSNLMDSPHSSKTRTIYFCKNCQKNVKVFKEGQFLPIFLVYLKKWATEKNLRQITLRADYEPEPDFIYYLFQDMYEYFKKKGNISSFLLFYQILNNNGKVKKGEQERSALKEILIEKMVNALEEKNFYDFLEGKTFYNREFGAFSNKLEERIIELVLDAQLYFLKHAESFHLKYVLEHFIEANHLDIIEILEEKEKYRKKFESNFYLGLSEALSSHQFEVFEDLCDLGSELGIYINVDKIESRFTLIKSLLKDCFQDVLMGKISSLGYLLEIIRKLNKFNLLKRELTKQEQKKAEELKQNVLFVENLKELFGTVSNSLIHYVDKIIPQILYNYLVINRNTSIFFTDIEQTVNVVELFFNKYVIYGLSVEKIGTLDRFIRRFEREYTQYKKEIERKEELSEKEKTKKLKFMEFSYKRKKHLIAPKNILKNKEKMLSKQIYNFYSLSMVLMGGLGPQGHGFTYSTPRGEVVEICSDIKENEAIVIKYKQFLKQQFLKKLGKELETTGIKASNIDKVISYLKEILNKQEKVNYFKKKPILHRIQGFLEEEKEKKRYEELMDKITEAIEVILRPISMVDQFKARMDLISEDKIESEDIAKLTSLKEKSHYDVLRERFFYQYVVKRFHEIYSDKKHLYLK
ncbi:MAG: hypothetical protein R6U96_16765 [Promethearchaeia archaeon]